MERSHGGVDPEVLLAEMRHRLANSLQLVTSLIRLRRNGAADLEGREHLSSILGVVEALSLLNRRLATPGDVAFQAYLREAASSWDRVAAERGVRVDVEAGADVAVPKASAVPLALAAHELVRDRVERAFPDGAAGRVLIRLRRGPGGGDGELSVVADGPGPLDGPGPPDGAGARPRGFALVDALAAQLGGALEVGGHPAGMAASIRFPLPGRAEAAT